MSDLATFLQEMIRIPSLSGSEAEAEAGDRMMAEMNRVGFDLAWKDERGNTFGLYRGTEPGPAWLLLTHLDIVNVGEVERWKHHPFEAVREGDLIYGRGSVDIKGALAAHIYLVAEMAAKGERAARDVVVYAATDEEIAGLGAKYFADNLPLGLPDGEAIEIGACIVSEPSSNRVMLGHRGVMRVILSFTGKAHHASLALSEQNPFFDLGTFLTRLRHYKLPEHPVVGPSGIAPTVIQGDSQSQNLTPNVLELLLDWRFGSETQADFERILAELTQGLSVSYKVFEFDQHGPKLPRLYGPEGVHVGGFAIAPDHPLVEMVQQALESVNPAAPKPGVWNFGTDGRYTFAKGIPTVGFGPGNPALAHTTEEVISLKEIKIAIEVLLEIVNKPIPAR